MTIISAAPEASTPAAARLARFAATLRPDTLPDAVRERAVWHLLDACGCARAASRLGEGTEATRVARRLGGVPEAELLADATRVPAPLAAFANASLAHALDFDDTHPGSICHISAVVGAAALAAGQANGRPGRDVVAAFVAGVETVARIGEAAQGAFHERGFHPTGVCGVFGAAIAAAMLGGLDESAITNTLGIAGSFTVGVFEFLADGSTTKRQNAAAAAHQGVIAALLASEGATGPASILEGRYGLYATHLGASRPVAVDDLGSRWETLAMAIKPYPACHFSHACLAVVEDLVATRPVDPHDVVSIRVGVPAPAVGVILEPAAQKPQPRSPYDAKFSLPWCLAALLVCGELSVTTFAPQRLADPQIVNLARRVSYQSIPLADAASSFAGTVAITLRDGTTRSGALGYPPGSPENPLAGDAIEHKFDRNAPGDGRLRDRLLDLFDAPAVLLLSG
jgi:2-methylcitrate dehydratase PrpD